MISAITGFVVLLITLILVRLCRGVEFFADAGCNREYYGGGGSDGGPSVFVLYHMPWCGYCKRLMPEWDKLYKDKTLNDLVSAGKLEILKINCEEDPAPGKRHGVSGYPTIVLYETKKDFLSSATGLIYDGERTIDAIKPFILKNTF